VNCEWTAEGADGFSVGRHLDRAGVVNSESTARSAEAARELVRLGGFETVRVGEQP
jgi:hypothetical protein